jgi:5-methylcytosine-specific restriction protein A
VNAMGRSVEKWVGGTDDTAIPPRVRLRIFDRARGRCQNCNRKLRAVDRWEVDHIVAIINGGANREDNFQCLCDWCHSAKTGADVAQKAKSDRIRKRHLGVPRRGRKMTSRNGFNAYPNNIKQVDLEWADEDPPAGPKSTSEPL